MEKSRRLVWDVEALIALENTLIWISKRSFQEAEDVELMILEKLDTIRRYPQINPPDKYRKNNYGSYRAIEVASFRITYRVDETEIRILLFRHVKQNPLYY